MDYEISWMSRAGVDLESILRRLTITSHQAAQEMHDGLMEAVDQLKRFPGIGALYDGRPGGNVREVLHRQYRIFYRVDDEKRLVEVMTIRHASSREPRLPD